MIDWTKLPIQPPAPLPATATDAQKAEWRELHRISATYAQAHAQNELAEATDRYTAKAGSRTRADVVLMLLDRLKVDAHGTNGAAIGLVEELADDLIRAVPGIVG